MPLLARRIDNDSPWADAEDQWENGDFPFEILHELRDGRSGNGGLSFYECKARGDNVLKRLAAAFYMQGTQTQDPKKLPFRFVHTNDLDKYGITYAKTLGDIGDVALRGLHYDITELDGPKALTLAKLLLKRPPMVIKQADITINIAKGLRLGWHPSTAAKDKCLSMLNKKSAVKFSERGL
ncbi:hypothetical protein [Methylobacterium sp. CM6246]